MGFDPDLWATGDDDALNAVLAERGHGRPLGAVLGDLRTLRISLHEALASLPEERLRTPYQTLHPEDTERGDGPLAEWALGLAEGHAGAHLGAIRARLLEAAGETPPTVAETLRRIDQADADLFAALAAVPSAATGGGGWTAADHALHVAAWTREGTAFIEGRPRAAAIGIAEADWATHEADPINAAIAVANRGRPLAEAIATLRRDRAAFRAAVAELDDDDLLAAAVAFQPDKRPASFDPAIAWVAEYGWDHSREHTESLRAMAPLGTEQP